jgi:hypothetical protein
MNAKTETFSLNTLSDLFNSLHGYYNLSGSDLSLELVKWNLLDESNQKDELVVVPRYVKWSFSASFLQLVNAWQWFLAGILLGRQVHMPAQVMQMYYYAIFFSYGAFLSAQIKGHYTLKWKSKSDGHTKKIRKEIWLGVDNDQLRIFTKDKRRGGEHEIRAKWFYEVFKSWDLRNSYPGVLVFESNRTLHSRFRNMYTYSLGDIARELHDSVPNGCPIVPSDKMLFDLWMHPAYFAEDFPETFWVLEHIKAVVDLHTKLLERYDKESPYTNAQFLLARDLYAHHQKTGMADLLCEAMNPIFTHMRIDVS